MNEQRIKELRELCEAATPGPWEHDWGNWDVEQVGTRAHVCQADNSRELNDVDAIRDLQFIAESRTAIPELLDEVEILKAQNKEMKLIIGYNGGLIASNKRLSEENAKLCNCLEEKIKFIEEELADLREENERLRESSIDLSGTFDDIERQVIEHVLRRNNGNKSATARDLKLGERTIQRKTKRYFVDPFTA